GLRQQLRRHRRESEHLNAVLDSVPAGIVVQDLDGRVISMNERARELLGSDGPVRTANLQALTAVVTDVLGPALSPGLRALGEPARVPLGDRMLSVHAGAVISLAQQRVGTVIVVLDVTDDVRREQARANLLGHLAGDVEAPLMELGRSAGSDAMPL